MKNFVVRHFSSAKMLPKQPAGLILSFNDDLTPVWFGEWNVENTENKVLKTALDAYTAWSERNEEIAYQKVLQDIKNGNIEKLIILETMNSWDDGLLDTDKSTDFFDSSEDELPQRTVGQMPAFEMLIGLKFTLENGKLSDRFSMPTINLGDTSTIIFQSEQKSFLWLSMTVWRPIANVKCEPGKVLLQFDTNLPEKEREEIFSSFENSLYIITHGKYRQPVLLSSTSDLS